MRVQHRLEVRNFHGIVSAGREVVGSEEDEGGREGERGGGREGEVDYITHPPLLLAVHTKVFNLV